MTDTYGRTLRETRDASAGTPRTLTEAIRNGLRDARYFAPLADQAADGIARHVIDLLAQYFTTAALSSTYSEAEILNLFERIKKGTKYDAGNTSSPERTPPDTL